MRKIFSKECICGVKWMHDMVEYLCKRACSQRKIFNFAIK